MEIFLQCGEKECIYIYKYIEWRKSAGCFVYAKLVR